MIAITLEVNGVTIINRLDLKLYEFMTSRSFIGANFLRAELLSGRSKTHRTTVCKRDGWIICKIDFSHLYEEWYNLISHSCTVESNVPFLNEISVSDSDYSLLKDSCALTSKTDDCRHKHITIQYESC